MEYRKGTYVITGVTGMMGGLLAATLLDSQECRQGDIQVVGLVRDGSRLGGKLRTAPQCFRFIECDFCAADFRWDGLLDQLPSSADYLIHCAAPTASSYMVSHPVETADSILFGTRNMLELARRIRAKSMVYLSSMEVYGRTADRGEPLEEAELGYVPLDSVRSCYPLGKTMGEHYCHIYQQEYGVPVKIARLAQVFGKGVRPEDNRVYMQFAKAVLGKRNIVLRTEGLSMGNYCASEDAAAAVFSILDRGEDGEVYNVVNEGNAMTIREMAELVAGEVANGAIGVEIRAEDARAYGYAPATQLRMSGKKLRELGWRPTKGLAEMYLDVIYELEKAGYAAGDVR